MITAENKKEYYQALLDKKTEYEGVFFVRNQNNRGILSVQHVLRENQNLRIVNFLKLPKKHS